MSKQTRETLALARDLAAEALARLALNDAEAELAAVVLAAVRELHVVASKGVGWDSLGRMFHERVRVLLPDVAEPGAK